MACSKNHDDIQSVMANIPTDQGGRGRHKCAACAYEKGFELGNKMEEYFNIAQIIDSLPESQAAAQHHKSPHAAFAQGYLDGINHYYNN